ncbi:MAG TPA: hypothetical protein VFE16_04425 [Candidatus Cybelea sp.]|nr:hypothetical protein [Candidatus Cybelea sp.]
MPDGSPAPPPAKIPAAPGWLSPNVRSGESGPLVYAGIKGNGEVLIYSETGYNQAPIGKITSGVSAPWGLYVDKNGSLYVANQPSPHNGGTVKVYPAGSLSPSTTYSQDLYRPLYPIVDQYGDLFVGNGNAYAGGGTVVEYQAGSTNAYQVLKTPGTEVDGMDFDPEGNLYVAYRVTNDDRGLGSIEEFAPGSAQGRILGMKVHKPQGLIVDNEGDIVVAETATNTKVIAVFRPGKRRPEIRVKLPTGSDATQIAITEDESRFFVASYTDGNIYVLPYPLSKESTWTVLDQTPGQGQLQGIALSNGQVF